MDGITWRPRFQGPYVIRELLPTVTPPSPFWHHDNRNPCSVLKCCVLTRNVLQRIGTQGEWLTVIVVLLVFVDRRDCKGFTEDTVLRWWWPDLVTETSVCRDPSLSQTVNRHTGIRSRNWRDSENERSKHFVTIVISTELMNLQVKTHRR